MSSPKQILISRRQALQGIAAAATVPFISPHVLASGSEYPFTLGVASGDPEPDGFVIWTRLAPKPLAADGLGGLSGNIPVRWKIALDEHMQRVVQQGINMATPDWAYSVHVEVEGLDPNRPYWYGFEALGEMSPIGRARTSPSLGTEVAKANFGLISCSHWEQGYFSAYRHLAEEQPDLVFFLGDYIYEYSYKPERRKVVRHHDTQHDAMTLADYRNRYALYKTDRDLQQLHAVAPCIFTWDDHEVQNDYANMWSQDPKVSIHDFMLRRAAGYKAAYEHMPLRRKNLPHGADMRIYRDFHYGDLAHFFVLDGRQYRSEQPCIREDGWRGGHVAGPSCQDRTLEQRTMLGFEQERWLFDGFKQSRGRWNIMAQDLLVAAVEQQNHKTGEWGSWTDGWDGYPATRERILDQMQQQKLKNPVFWGGDIHSFWATELRQNQAENPNGATIATEFVTTSITSDGPPHDAFMRAMPRNPHVKFFDSRYRGYTSVELTSKAMKADFKIISDREDPNASLSTLNSFWVTDGEAKVHQA